MFHELARHLQTRRLIAGDSISLDEDKSFYCVIDGTVQVFTQTGQTATQHAWDHEDVNGYQLLNEVGSGGTLSSLFTILSLFTEDVKMSWQDDHGESPFVSSPIAESIGSSRSNADVSALNLEQRETPRRRRRTSLSSSASTVQNAPLERDGYASASEEDFMGTAVPPSQSYKGNEVYHGLVARATEDTTLAVIPAEAFRRLTQKFPKATGHIVQGVQISVGLFNSILTMLLVILTRFSRVTFSAAHEYLGLTSEVLRTEKVINDIACHPLPASFYEGGGLQYLRQRFDSTDRSDSAESDYFSYPHVTESPVSISSKTLSTESIPNPTEEKRGKINTRPELSSTASTSFPFRHYSSRHLVQAGDLLTSTDNPDDGLNRGPMTRPTGIRNTPRVTQKSINLVENRRAANMSGDDFDLREEVMSCIAKSIGLLQPPLDVSESIEASPAVRPVDDLRAGGAGGLFTSSFSSLSLLDLNDDASSATGGSSALPSPRGYMVGA